MTSEYTPVSFVLSALNQDITSVLATIESMEPEPLSYDATSIKRVKLSDVLATFKFQTDSADLTDLSAADVKYYVHSTHMGLDASWNPMVDSVVAIKDGADTWGRIASSGSDGVLFTDLSPSADYLRHLAEVLFGTHFGVDLFTNETSIKDFLISSTSGLIQNALNAAASMTISDTTDANLCRALMMQILANNSQRFQDVSATDLEQSVPIQVNDSISFRVVVRAAETQADITGASNARLVSEQLSGLTLNKLDKVYKIKLLVVADADI